MERLGSESNSSIKVDSDLSMEIDPPSLLHENIATAKDWRRALGRVVLVVVVLHTNTCRSFDTESLGTSYPTDFVGPVVAKAMFVNHEEVPMHPIYRDTVEQCFFVLIYVRDLGRTTSSSFFSYFSYFHLIPNFFIKKKKTMQNGVVSGVLMVATN